MNKIITTEIDRRGEEVYVIDKYEEFIYIFRVLKTIVEVDSVEIRLLHITKGDAVWSNTTYTLSDAIKAAYKIKDRLLKKDGCFCITVEGCDLYETNNVFKDAKMMQDQWHNNPNDDYVKPVV